MSTRAKVLIGLGLYVGLIVVSVIVFGFARMDNAEYQPQNQALVGIVPRSCVGSPATFRWSQQSFYVSGSVFSIGGSFSGSPSSSRLVFSYGSRAIVRS